MHFLFFIILVCVVVVVVFFVPSHLSLSHQVQELYEEIAKHKEDSSKMWTELVAEKEKVTDLEER